MVPWGRPVLCWVLWGRQVPGVVGTLCCVRTILWQLTQVVQSGEQRRVCCWWVDCHSRVWSDAMRHVGHVGSVA